MFRLLVSSLFSLIVLSVFVQAAKVKNSKEEMAAAGDESCQQRFPFDRRDCDRPGATCCPGPHGPTECGLVTKSGLPKGRELKNAVCCLPVESICAKNKRYDACCYPLECQEENGKKKCMPAKEAEEMADSSEESAEPDQD